MPESLSGSESIDTRLGQIGEGIKALLSGVQEVSDGTNLNTFDNVAVPSGVILGISKSIKPNRQIGYHVRKELPEDETGNYETWDYHWGDREPQCLQIRSHTSRRFSSSFHLDDKFKKWGLGNSDIEAMQKILGDYSENKSKEEKR